MHVVTVLAAARNDSTGSSIVQVLTKGGGGELDNVKQIGEMLQEEAGR